MVQVVSYLMYQGLQPSESGVVRADNRLETADMGGWNCISKIVIMNCIETHLG